MAPHHQVLLCLAAVFLLSAAAVTADDEAVMSAFLSGFSSPPSGWNESTPYCQWTGVECDASKRVTKINLDNRFLSGHLPVDLNKLSELQYLYLRDNKFSGPLPFLSGLASLQQAFLDGNRFDSAPPGFLRGLTSLQRLGLSLNPNLSPWSLPTELVFSRSLVVFSASNARLTGPIPNMFDAFPNLQDLDLSHNNLSGHIPPSLGNLPKILYVDLSDNNLSGPWVRFPPLLYQNFSSNPLLGNSESSSSGFSLGQDTLFASVVGVVASSFWLMCCMSIA